MQVPSLLPLLLLLSLGCGPAIFADAAPALFSPAQPAPAIPWDQAFPLLPDQTPLHFVAHYQDAHGTHRLEEWRRGSVHLRRVTDTRIDLHADAAAIPRSNLPIDYLWQIIDRDKKILHRVSSQAMLHAGMFYNFYSMAHVLARPAGRFVLTKLADTGTSEQPIHMGDAVCTWFQLSPEGQPASRICWSQQAAIPLKIEMQTGEGVWTEQFQVDSLDRRPIPPAVFEVDSKGLQVRNVDEMQQED